MHRNAVPLNYPGSRIALVELLVYAGLNSYSVVIGIRVGSSRGPPAGIGEDAASSRRVLDCHGHCCLCAASQIADLAVQSSRATDCRGSAGSGARSEAHKGRSYRSRIAEDGTHCDVWTLVCNVERVLEIRSVWHRAGNLRHCSCQVSNRDMNIPHAPTMSGRPQRPARVVQCKPKHRDTG